jgi:hypothetical protein
MLPSSGSGQSITSTSHLHLGLTRGSFLHVSTPKPRMNSTSHFYMLHGPTYFFLTDLKPMCKKEQTEVPTVKQLICVSQNKQTTTHYYKNSVLYSCSKISTAAYIASSCRLTLHLLQSHKKYYFTILLILFIKYHKII